MAGSINKIILVGNLGKDPEIRSTQSGLRIASFSIATSERWQDKVTNEKKDITQWHRIVVFNENLVDVIDKYVKKGTKLYIEGSMQYRKYVDNNGIERNISEVILSKFKGELQILDSKNSKEDGHTSSQDYSSDNKSATSAIETDLDDDIPF